MPLYEYECVSEKCAGHRTTLLRSISEMEDAAACEKCSGPTKKVISMSAFHLKGGGWAKSGYGTPSSVDGYNGCKTYKQRLQRAAELGEDKPNA